MKIAIYQENNKGFVSYSELDKSVLITFPVLQTRKKIYHYLTTTKEFTVPGSSGIGDRRLLVKKPNDSAQLLEMSLCEMYHSIGIHVDWNNKDNEFNSINKPNGKIFDIIN